MEPVIHVIGPGNSELPRRLRSARLAVHLSMREVAHRLRGQAAISHATLASYERGQTQPKFDTLVALAATYGRPVSWFIASGPELTGVCYRNLVSRYRVRDRESFEAEVAKWAYAYLRLEDRLGARRRARVREVPDATADPRRLAEWVRKEREIGSEQPIPSVLELLDRFGVYALEIKAPFAVDGLAARFGDEHLVILNPSVSNDRARMNAGHELAHVLYGDCIDDSEARAHRAVEARAMEFASHLLMPSRVLRSAFAGRSMVRLVKFKERFGISLAAMVLRAEREDVIPNSLAKKLWVEFSKRGWRRHEPGAVRPDRATRFEQLLDGAVVRGDITWKDAAEVTGVRISELKNRVQEALGFGNEYPDDPAGPDMFRLVK